MRTAIFVILTFIAVSLLFFYPLFKGKIPFPGDLLMGEYAPYNSYSFMGYAPGGYPNKGQDFDVLRLLYPEKEFSVRMFKSFEFPLWNPYNFSGNPHLASLQSGSFYPLNIIFFIFPYLAAWTIFILLQSILAGIFTFLFARELKLSMKSSFFSALVFAFSSYSVVWMEYGNMDHSIVWMPFAMWLTLKNLQKPTILKSIAISLALTFAILAGYIQTAFYVFVFIFGFIIFNIFVIGKKEKLKKLSIFCLIFISPILLSAVQLLPTIELFFQSARAPYSHSSFLNLLIPPFHIITLLVPDFFGNPATRNYWLSGTYIERVTYVGVIPLIFILYSFFKKQNSTFWFCVGSAILVLFLTFKTPVSSAIYFFQIPFISTAVPTRIMFLFCFSASLVAGFGLEEFIKNPNKKILFKTILILGGVYGLLWLFTFVAPIVLHFPWVVNLQISKRNLLLPTGIFILGAIILLSSFYAEKYKKFTIIFIIILSMMDLFYFFQKITPFSPKETVYPKTEVLTELKTIQGIDRSWGYGSGYISTNLQTYEKIFSVDGYNALNLKRYDELLSSSKDGKIANYIPRSDSLIAPGYGATDLRKNRYRQVLLNLLGVKYILNKNELLGKNWAPDYTTFPQHTYKLVWQKTPWQIYANKEVLPRIFLVSNYVVERNKNKIIQMIFAKNFDLRTTVILEENIFPKINFSSDPKAKIILEKYSPNEIIVKTSARTNMLLLLSDNFYPGWDAYVDGKNEKIYRADYSFRAVVVHAGIHKLRFIYKPRVFIIGLIISLTAFLLAIVTVIYAIIKSKGALKYGKG